MKRWTQLVLFASAMIRERQVKQAVGQIAVMPILAMLIGAAFAGSCIVGFLLLYRELLAQGLSEQGALMTLLALLLSLTILLVLVAIRRLENLKRSLQSPTSQLEDIVRAFQRGWEETGK